MSLSVVWGTSTKKLGFAATVTDHFYGTVLAETVEVHLVGRPEEPVPAASGGTRHADGSYRFLALPAGTYTLEVSDPTGRWTIDPSARALTLPLADPAARIDFEARPSPRWSSPPGRTVIRARVERSGAPLPGAELSIDDGAGPFAKSTRTDADGEAVHPIAGAAALTSDGRIALTLRVTGETVQSILVDGISSAGAIFHAQPGRATRVRVALNP